MIKETIKKLAKGEDLSLPEAKEAFEAIFDSKAAPVQIATFLTSLRLKGESEAEIEAAALVIRARAKKVHARGNFMGFQQPEPIIDTCGTGGSGINKFNISTASAFVVAASGVKVAKHGNRGMSSKCGSADVLEALGIDIAVDMSVMEAALKKVGIAFLYAPLYHPALGAVAQIRKEMGIRTIFNILGPLCNPASADYQLLGVYSRDLIPVLARALKGLGTKKALVVNSKDLGDEISLSGPTYAAFLNNKKITDLRLSAASFGLKKSTVKDLQAKDAAASGAIINDIFANKLGPARDIVLANSAACFYILGKAANLKLGVKLAADLISQGQVAAKFKEFKEFLASQDKDA